MPAQVSRPSLPALLFHSGSPAPTGLLFWAEEPARPPSWGPHLSQSLSEPRPLSTKLHGRSLLCSDPPTTRARLPSSQPSSGSLAPAARPSLVRPIFPCETGSSLRIRGHCLSTDSCNKVLQTHWLETTDMHSLTGLQASSPKSRCPQGHILFRGSKGESFLA